MKLDEVRMQIDEIDEKIVKLISGRIGLVSKMGRIKKQLRLTVKDTKREKEVLEHVTLLAKTVYVDEKLIRDIFHRIIAHARKIQKP